MTTLQTIPDAASAEIIANEVNQTLSAAGIYGKRHPVTSGLSWGYYGGRYNGNTIADGTVTLTDNATNYLVVLRSTGVVSVSTTSTHSTDPLYARLYKLTTVSGVVTVELDERWETNGLMLSSSASAGTVTSVDASGGVQTVSGSAISATGTIRGANLINAQTGTSYAVVAGDRGKHVTLSNAASIAATIAQAGTTGFEDGYFIYLECIGVGAATLTPATSTINGAATLVLTSGMSAVVFSDGTNYRALVLDRAGISVNAHTGTSYTVLSGDRAKLVTHTNASAIAVTLPQATGAFGAGWFMWVRFTEPSISKT